MLGHFVPLSPRGPSPTSSLLALSASWTTFHLREDEIRFDASWPGGEAPALEHLQQALSQPADWGNLIAQPDTARVSSLEDFYRARFLYRL